MEFLGEVAAWFSDPASWEGRNSIPLRLWEHVSLSATALALGVLIALPIGLAIGHSGRGARAVVAVTNTGRAIPSLGWLRPWGRGPPPRPSCPGGVRVGAPPPAGAWGGGGGGAPGRAGRGGGPPPPPPKRGGGCGPPPCR